MEQKYRVSQENYKNLYYKVKIGRQNSQINKFSFERFVKSRFTRGSIEFFKSFIDNRSVKTPLTGADFK